MIQTFLIPLRKFLKQFTNMSDNTNSNILDTLWNHKVYGKIVQFALGTGITLLIIKFFGTDAAYLKILIGFIFGILTVFFIETQKVRETNDSLKKEILDEIKTLNLGIMNSNSNSNDQLKTFITENVSNDLENKIYRKLVSTNAIIPTRENKLSITARILDIFKDESDYKNDQLNNQVDESIDFVRLFAYQNLILTPKYLAYFFYRKESVKKATRIIVVAKDHVNGGICQATLTYLFMSSRIGYETYLIPEDRYKEILRSKLTENQIKVVKGNPSIVKTTDNNQTVYKGDYTDFKANIETGKNMDINGIEHWNCLELFIKNSKKVTPKSTGFEEHIKNLLQTASQSQIVE